MMVVTIADSDAQFAALEPRWEALQESAVLTSIFESFDWQHLWWKSYGRKRPLRLMVASDGGATVGILPLYIDTVDMLKFPVRLLRFVGTGGDTFPDDLGPLMARGREAEVAAAFADAVMRLPGWDVLLLSDMNPECAFTQTINRAVKNARLEALTGRSDRIVYLQLPATWDEWLKGLKSDRRRKVLQTRKKMAEPNRYFVWSDPATLDQGVDRLVELHRKRWDNGPERSYSWSSPEYIGFHRAVMSACLKKDRLRLYCLELSGQIIALLYFYKFRDQLYLMQSGYDPEHNKLSPGQALLFFVVENAIGEGNKVIDFLKGDHRYKDELATGERETVYLTAFGRRPGAWVYRARRMYLPAIKARLIELLRRARPAPKTE